MVDHRVHGPGGDGCKQLRPTHDFKGLRVAPVGLGEDPYPVSQGLEEALQVGKVVGDATALAGAVEQLRLDNGAQ